MTQKAGELDSTHPRSEAVLHILDILLATFK